MPSCNEFIAAYSDLRDDLLPLPFRTELERHLAECASCARYDRVVRDGIDSARRLPALEPSDDFMARLQHRIFHEDEPLGVPGRYGSGASPALAVVVATLLGVAAWLPVARSGEEPYQLPPVLAQAPPSPAPTADLFGSGPMLLTSANASLGWTPDPESAALLFRHSPLGRTVNDAVQVRYSVAP